jgi:anti-anti-sigma regulatory factor
VLLTGKKMRATRGRLALCNLPEPVREVFEISGFLSIFSVFDDRGAAVAAVAPPAA